MKITHTVQLSSVTAFIGCGYYSTVVQFSFYLRLWFLSTIFLRVVVYSDFVCFGFSICFSSFFCIRPRAVFEVLFYFDISIIVKRCNNHHQQTHEETHCIVNRTLPNRETLQAVLWSTLHGWHIIFPLSLNKVINVFRLGC